MAELGQAGPAGPSGVGGGGKGSFSAAASSARAFANDLDKVTEASARTTAQLAKQSAAAKEARAETDKAAQAAKEAQFAIEKMGDGLAGIALAIDQAGVALKGMATVVGQVQEQISNGNKEVADLIAKLDSIAKDTGAQGYINKVVNLWKEHKISAEELKADLAEIFRGLEAINAQGSGFLGDLQKQANDTYQTIQQILDAIEAEKEQARNGGGAQSQDGGAQTAGGIGGEGGGALGSSSTSRGGPTSQFGATLFNEVGGNSIKGRGKITGSPSAPSTFPMFAADLRRRRR